MIENIDIDINLEKSIILKMDIFSNTPVVSPPNIRLCIKLNDLISINIKAKKNKYGEIEMLIPKMKNIIPKGKYLSIVEVIIDNQYYTPLEFFISFYDNYLPDQSNSYTKSLKRVYV